MSLTAAPLSALGEKEMVKQEPPGSPSRTDRNAESRGGGTSVTPPPNQASPVPLGGEEPAEKRMRLDTDG